MIFKKLEDRYNVAILVFGIICIIILLRLMSIMIVRGEEYRIQAENSIFKTIPTSAPRFEIKDRYGRLLAGNRPSFAVHIMKNEIIDEKINEVALNVISILEKNGDRFIDDFPIVMSEKGDYVFTFDVKIQEWKDTYNIQEEYTAIEAFDILRKRYGIRLDLTMEDIVNNSELAIEVQQQLIAIPELSIPISRLTWKFTEQMRKEQWLQNYRITDLDIDAYEAFQIARNKTFKIPADYSDAEARKVMVVRDQLRRSGYLQYRPVKIAQDISEESVTQIEENIIKLPGVNIEIEPVRYYPEGKLGAHVLGNLGKISDQKEIDRYVRELGYLPTDIIGKTGVEQRFEEELKGTDGYRKVIVDSRGRLVNLIENVDAIPGGTLYLTLDANLQRVAEQTLEDVLKTIQVGGTYQTQWGTNRLQGTSGPMVNATSGSVVVTDVKTGEVLALANYPAYDPNLFATGISLEDWNKLIPENQRDPLAPRPLTNIALSTAIQPGSIYKMIVGLAGLEQGLSPEYKILDRGFIQVGGHSFGNWLWNQRRETMGYQGIHQAIADSNNYYFYSVANGYDYGVGRPLPIRMNMDILVEYSRKFGLNDMTGIEIDTPRERNPGIPNIQKKTEVVRGMLRSHLTAHLKQSDLDKEKIEVSDEVRLGIIKEIVSWTDENPARGEINRRLVNLGVKEDRANIFTDIIKYSYFAQARWSTADTMNFAIGQGEHAYTSLQMVNYMATLANGGNRYNLSLVRKVQKFEDKSVTVFEPILAEKIELKNPKNLDEINYGMHLTTTTGTAQTYFRNLPVKVAGKTGTAQRSGKIPPTDEVEYLKRHMGSFGVRLSDVEDLTLQLMIENRDNVKYQDRGNAMREAIKILNPKVNNNTLDQFKKDYDNYAWFTGFAPYDDPQIAISVLIFQGGSGGFASPIFREIVAEYMGLNSTSKEEFGLENRLVR
ncbi:penicillin-binding transpeptidase domain-containing protein [Serpentinicella alkaliphila]|uniref:Penicillin-binding protein 2 n=1 Tax=Serpentinicella alkaliphila TaxID=1734049 RepID=A0A4R2TFB5_9FIRM|nr:penicillin-binding transpeptidase domain-containing protein [Serpentinicella alkaliphila]QUH26058.1 penicillin-binding protein [Serpentinicella alkaliphila]TCP99754.1 penicillin-binding protein 2 [Serpentinicella alkaliphila]